MSTFRRAEKIRRSLSKIDDQLAALATMAADPGLCASATSDVSAWSIGEQIDHLRRSDQTILAALGSLGDSGSEGGSPTLVGRLVLLMGFIPRGKGRAPGATTPLDFTTDSLESGLAQLRRRFAQLYEQAEDLAACRARIQHPALGSFDAAQMIAFTAIHHHHHLKIIDDIRRAVVSA
jgi:hypothetical protein